MILLAFIVGFSAALHAQQTRPVTLSEAIDLSLRNSKELRNSRAKVDEATAVLRQAKDNQLPDLKVSGSYLRVTQPNIDLKIKTAGGGGQSGTGGQSGGATPNLNNIKVDQAMYGIANLSLPLFSGFKIRYGIESARLLEKAAGLDADNDREDVILNTIDAFANLYKAHANVTLLQENLAQSMKRDSDFANLEKNGLLARNDMLKAELQTSTIEYNLVDAQNNEQLADVTMDLLLGLPERTILLPDSTSLQETPQLQDIDTYEKEALENRSDVTALRSRARAAQLGVKSAKGDYYPVVALSGGYVAADIPNLFSVTNAVTYGIALQYNIGSFWKTGAKVAQQKAKERQLAASQDLLNDNIRLQVTQSYNDYLAALKKIEVSRKAIVQGQENYKITKNKYNNSLVTMTDLLEANVSLLQAQINLELARADAVVAYHTIQRRAGILK
jgi:outer membrane protein TolC